MKNKRNRGFFVGLGIGVLLGISLSLFFLVLQQDNTMEINTTEIITNQTGNVSSISVDIQQEKTENKSLNRTEPLEFERSYDYERYERYETPEPPELETYKLDMPNMDYEAPPQPIEYSPEPIKPIKQPTTGFDYPDKLVR